MFQFFALATTAAVAVTAPELQVTMAAAVTSPAKPIANCYS